MDRPDLVAIAAQWQPQKPIIIGSKKQEALLVEKARSIIWDLLVYASELEVQVEKLRGTISWLRRHAAQSPCGCIIHTTYNDGSTAAIDLLISDGGHQTCPLALKETEDA